MLTIFLQITMGLVFIQDLKWKTVYWFLFPIIFGLCLWLKWNENGLYALVFNLGLTLFLLFGLTVYLSLKLGELTNPMKGFFAWGDVLFLIAITPFFTPFEFALFISLGSCFSLLVHLILYLFKKANQQIPFAGYMALFFVAMSFYSSKLSIY